MKLLASSLGEDRFAFHGDFFQGFETIGNKTGADNIDAPGFLFAKLLQSNGGIRTQPLGTAEPGLETDLVSARVQLQRLGQKPSGFLALAMVGVALIQGNARHAMKT